MRRRIPKLIISAVFFAMCWVRDGALRLAGRRIPGRCTVLYYHSVPAEHKARFEAQMDDLLHFTVPAAADQVAPLEPGKRYAIVTFDDAYQNILVNALPALEARGIHSTVFVVSPTAKTTSWGSDPSVRCEAHSQSISIDDLRRLPTALVAIGSHSLTHAHLTRLKTADAAYELIESRRLLEEQLQRPIRLFSFPYGACNDELIRLCREAGYERIFTTLPESALSEPDEFVTGRVRVDPTDSRLEFRLKLIGAYRWLPAAFAIRKALFGRHADAPVPKAILPRA